MFGKRRAESGDNADGKFSGSQVCKKGDDTYEAL